MKKTSSRLSFGAAVIVWIVLAIFSSFLSVPSLARDSDIGKGKFNLGGTAVADVDPTDATNEVIRMSVAEGIFGFVTRDFDKATQVEDLSSQLSFHFRFASGGSCGGGSPRYQLAIDTDGDGMSNGNAFGYVGPFPSFTGCPDDTWLFEDLTDASIRWDLTQFNDELAGIGQATVNVLCGSFVCTWGQTLTVFGNFPNHRVLRGSLADDFFTGSTRGATDAFYDNIEIGGRKLRWVGDNE